MINLTVNVNCQCVKSGKVAAVVEGGFRHSASKGCKTTDGISLLSVACRVIDEYNTLYLY